MVRGLLRPRVAALGASAHTEAGRKKRSEEEIMITLVLIILLTVNGTIGLAWGITLGVLLGVGLTARMALWIADRI